MITLIAPRENLIKEVSKILLESSCISNNIVVFPGKRPGHFLRKSLSEKLGAHPSPRIIPVDAFADLILGEEPLATDLDLAAVLYDEIKEETLSVFGLKDIDLDSFLPWAFKIISDFEEVKIELKSEKEISVFDEILPSELRGPKILKRLKNFSKLYSAFYKKLEEKGLSTRSMKYARLAGEIDISKIESFENIIFAGFFAFTAAERKIIKRLSGLPGFWLISSDGPGIKEQFSFLDPSLKAEEKILREDISLKFYKSSEIHGEVMKLRETLSKEKMKSPSESVVVLPDAGSLFPVIYNSMAAGENYNVSMGYPATATPVYSMINSLAGLLDKKSGDKYFTPDYLRFVFHPYIKNIYMGKATEPSRIIFQTVEEVLSGDMNKYVSLEDVEQNGKVIEASLDKIVNYSGEKPEAAGISGHLNFIHSKTIKPFEEIRDIGDFAQKLLDLISFISENSTAHMHAYWAPFAQVFIDKTLEIKNCGLSKKIFSGVSAYFRFFFNSVASASYPFEGTPLRGAQVLGFLETRNLKFNRVYFMDANADVLPSAKKEDTLLSHFIRENLGLSTYKKREKISAYYFFTLINSAREAHIFYRDNPEKERSPFVERLAWEISKRKEKPEENDVYFDIMFSRHEPGALPKTEEMMRRLVKREYSPSSLDAYLACGLRFYYRYVLNLSEKDEISGEIEQKDIGSMVHDILEEFFKRKLNAPLEIFKEDYKLIKKIARKIFADRIKNFNTGYEYVIKTQIEKRLGDILDYHGRKLAGVRILACEKDLATEIDTKFGMVNLKGRADRIQRRGPVTEIVDYKTGSRADTPNWVRFDPEKRGEWPKTLKSVQLPFYVLAYLKNHGGLRIENLDASLMLLGSEDIKEEKLFKAINKKFLENKKKEKVFKRYEAAIKILIEEILDMDKKFEPVSPDNAGDCKNCPFKTICGRQWVE